MPTMRLGIILAAIVAAIALAAGGFLVGSAARDAGGGQVAEQPQKEPKISASVSGIVVDETGRAIVASIEITNKADDTRTRYQTDILGHYDLRLEQGDYVLEFTKGYEFMPSAIEVSIENRLRQRQDAVKLERGVDLPLLGWYGGDLHQHSSYEEAQQDVVEIFVSNLANGLNWGALTDHNTLAGLTEWARAGEVTKNAADSLVTIPGLEVTTDRGHIIVLEPGHLINHSTNDGTADIERIIAEAKADGSTIQLNHPFLTEPMGFKDWQLHEQFDLLEIWNGKAAPIGGTNGASKESWYELLNSGVYIPATADSDNHDLGGGYIWEHGTSKSNSEWMTRGLFSGDPRTYVHTSAGASPGSIVAALKAGNSFLTNGPLLLFSLNGAGPGNSVAVPSGVASLSLKAFDRRGLERASLIENGVVIKEFALEGINEDITSIDIPVKAGSWYLVEGFGESGGYAITNPVFIR